MNEKVTYIKQEIHEAGRTGHVNYMLDNLIKESGKKENKYYPVKLYLNKKGKARYYIKGETVKKQAKKLYNALQEDSTTLRDLSNIDFFLLLKYFEDKSDTLLHNYAVGVSHRQTNGLPNMETIRTVEIIENLLSCAVARLYDEEDGNTWTIPIGWRAEEEYTG